jgi:hypothetical protein
MQKHQLHEPVPLSPRQEIERIANGKDSDVAILARAMIALMENGDDTWESTDDAVRTEDEGYVSERSDTFTEGNRPPSADTEPAPEMGRGPTGHTPPHGGNPAAPNTVVDDGSGEGAST